MNAVFRHVAGLVTLLVVFLAVLGTLLSNRQDTVAEFATRSRGFFMPVLQQVVAAERGLERMLVTFQSAQDAPGVARAVPRNLELRAMLDAVGGNLSELTRLCLDFGYDAAFDLPSRAQRQLDSARRALASREGPERDVSSEHVFTALGPLRSTLAQLQRLIELDLHEMQALERETTARMSRNLVFASVALVLVAAPLLWGLARGLRQAVQREVRVRRDLEEAKLNLESMALYDDLTGLGNRHLFKARLEQVAGAAGRTTRRSALMYLDVDHFKRINDTLGHDAGDKVLKIIGARLREGIRAGDTVARIGGDEFTVIVNELDSGTSAGAIASKLMQRIALPIVVSGHEFVVSVSVGITVIPDDGDDPAALMKNADIALYEAKDQGRGDFHFFVEEMNRAILAQTRMERDLRTALRDGGLSLHYQPLVSLACGQVLGMEALLRWRRADGAEVPPAEFIPVAEKSGLMIEMGAWALRQACRDLAAMRAGGNADLRMSVNLSPRQLRDPGLRGRVETALSEHDLPAQALELEITESTLIEDVDVAVAALRAMRDLGVTVAIDDFGVGYSSLGYLKQLPLDALKIDRSFIRDIETDEDDRSIVSAILAMAGSLSLRVVAEGIETEAQRRYLAGKGCDLGQGHLFARPAPLEVVRGALSGQRPGPPARPGGLRLV